MWSLEEDFTIVKSPLDIKYMKILKIALNGISAWDVRYIEGMPSKYIVFKKVSIIISSYTCLFTGIAYLKNNFGFLPFLELGHTCITVLMTLVAGTRMILIFLQSYHSLIVRFIQKIHLLNYKDVSEHAMKIHLMVHKLSHYFTLYLSALTVLGTVLFHCIPVYANISSGAYSKSRPENVTFQHSVYYELPFDYKNNIWGYITLFISNIYLCYVATLCFIAFDLLISLLIFHVWGHLKILIRHLEEFPLPQSLDSDTNRRYTYSDEESVIIHNKLRESIIHHKLIMDSITAITDTMGVHMLMYYAFHQVCGCFLLLQCSQMDAAALSRYGPLTLILFQQLIQISVVFELLGSLYEKLSFAIYNTPWEFMNTRNRKLVLTFLRQAQRPIKLKAGSMVTVGVQTMATIIKTSVSYFIMLRTVAVNK